MVNDGSNLNTQNKTGSTEPLQQVIPQQYSKMLSNKVLEVQDNELNILDEDSDEEELRQRYIKRDKNMDIIVPLKGNYNVPDFLIDFIQNDPNFVPEVHSNNLEDAFISINNEI